MSKNKDPRDEACRILDELISGDHLWDYFDYPTEQKSKATARLVARARKALKSISDKKVRNP